MSSWNLFSDEVRRKTQLVFWWGNLKERDYVGNLDINGVILKWILRE
jgi:hypothetical protein